MRRIALLLAAVVIAGGIAVTSTAAAQSESSAKLARIAVPEYWYGYWPGNPTLCVLDQTDGLPVAEAVAEFDRTAIDLQIRDSCDDTETIIVYPIDEPNAERSAHTFYADGDGVDRLSGVAWIQTNIAHQGAADDWRLLLIHELGHAIGLDHTNRRDSIMNPSSLIYELDGLTETDMAILELLYAD